MNGASSRAIPTMALSATAAAPAPTVGFAPPPTHVGDVPASAPLVLVVDDEPINTYVIRVLLHENGYRVMEAPSGDQAMELLAREPIDVVVCDMRMPRMDGEQVLGRVRHQYPTVPVIMLTGFIDVHSAVQVLRQGACDYLTKPIDPAEALVAVERAVDQRRDALRRQQLEEENRRLRGELARLGPQSLAPRTPGETAREFERGAMEVLSNLATVAEERIPSLKGHGRRTAQFARLVAREARLDENAVLRLQQAALVLAAGRMFLPEPFALREDFDIDAERPLFERHLKHTLALIETLAPLAETAAIVKQRYERFQGGGLPEGTSGPQILPEARLLAVAETFDLITLPRNGRPIPPEQGLADLESRKMWGRLDPVSIDLFTQALGRKLQRRSIPTEEGDPG